MSTIYTHNTANITRFHRTNRCSIINFTDACTIAITSHDTAYILTAITYCPINIGLFNDSPRIRNSILRLRRILCPGNSTNLRTSFYRTRKIYISYYSASLICTNNTSYPSFRRQINVAINYTQIFYDTGIAADESYISTIRIICNGNINISDYMIQTIYFALEHTSSIAPMVSIASD